MDEWVTGTDRWMTHWPIVSSDDDDNEQCGPTSPHRLPEYDDLIRQIEPVYMHSSCRNANATRWKNTRPENDVTESAVLQWQLLCAVTYSTSSDRGMPKQYKNVAPSLSLCLPPVPCRLLYAGVAEKA